MSPKRPRRDAAALGRDPNSDEHWLHAAAELARQRAYAPYSGFTVGAALLTTAMRPLSKQPDPVTGANVENGSYGLTICAERSAVFGAIAAGLCPDAVQWAQSPPEARVGANRKACLTVIAIAGEADTLSPCGACRQVLHEFATPTMRVVFPIAGELRSVPLADLVPVPFKLNR
jgi:homotetrameric cytidine deaminase